MFAYTSHCTAHLPGHRVSRVTMHISRVTEEVINFNNAPNIVLNIPEHVSTWLIIILLDSLLLRIHQVKIIQKRP